MQNEKQLLTVKNLVKHFDISGGLLDQLAIQKRKIVRKRTIVKALNDISLEINAGETLGVVGESGCGKSTLARTVLCLYKPNSGEIYYKGNRIDGLNHKEMLPFRTKMQMIFQDPYASLNPRMTVTRTLEEPVLFHDRGLTSREVQQKVADVMEQVGVDPTWSDRYPHEFSGGQRQRISIARALMVDPEFVVADEPVSALDVSIQAQILNLLMEAQQKRGLTYMLITHDLSVVQYFATRVAVLYLGMLCEEAETAELFNAPRHPYTQALLAAIPKLGEKKAKYIKMKGEVPTPINLPSGCVFHGRCPFANERCEREVPSLQKQESRIIACHAVEEGRL
ncbi:MAG: ATP-binding cassette domain-containing protein [Deltaproteobacteria bacterium]|jgi:peptide/nickel transport system ATP-binding protein|nr:ATP-binding cassette domain-containing protein [Deltaproteobacteria bacterium]MBT4091341.1 ATP-binding cassette domain-containing protein [Deltaproteobacteria bacterium]MBT4268803.1 ATP-binding cassette domain-containing protein [Deltaproteobacteria bacterium]MBT4638325.1 ATP-binding cassette domain-containing protein [Deltaproteobacteria bacterium]MBT6499661.1 ATP-binding cassette domain-containing protein [Deltaproteobacteria bacterium]